ncbi:ABC transporter ATP-binding protein [Roseobacter sp.]|uniref:ABC transporter ATP-binding protein n=1 Tax=Roseobacter sp. TaxID=1907202 RepID=UPI002965EC83|nr:ABC transporter ATP-binding protein [Roseobacter sp.]MDW3180400.1 ABC transporter ATP-binding protein [Roseobacter sp.]
MSLSHRYRNFGGVKPSDAPREEISSEVTEDQQLQSFENGYQAGWDDAVKAQADSVAKISAEFGQNLQDMSFTYHEALSKLTSSMKPVMAEIVDKLLPPLTRDSLGMHIVDQLMEMIKEQPNQPIQIVVAPSQVETIQDLAEGKLTDPFEVVAEQSLGDGQAFVRIGSVERSIDLDAVLAGIGKAIAAFFHEAEQEKENG